jgi:MFS family permease
VANGGEGGLSERRFAALTRGITRNVVVLGVVSLLTDISSEMLVYVIPLFLANILAASPSVIGVIEGLAESIASLLRLISGTVSDRVGRRKVLIGFGYGASVVGKALFLLATTWPIVLIARVGDRIGKGIRTAPRDALISESTPSDSRGRAFGFHRAMDTTGAFIGVGLAAVIVWLVQGDATLLSPGTFQVLVLVALVPGVLSVLTIALGVRDVRARKKDRSAAVRSAEHGLGRFRRLGAGLPREFWFYILATALFTAGNSSDAFLSLRSQQLGLSVRDLLLVIIAFNVTNAVVAWPAGALSDRVGRRALLALGWAIYALAYAGFALAPSVPAIAGLWLFYGAYHGVNEAVGRALVADLAPEDKRGTAYGISTGVLGVMLLPASVVAGVLWDGIGPGAPFWFGSACAAGAIVVLLAAPRPAGRQRRPGAAA